MRNMTHVLYPVKSVYFYDIIKSHKKGMWSKDQKHLFYKLNNTVE